MSRKVLCCVRVLVRKFLIIFRRVSQNPGMFDEQLPLGHLIGPAVPIFGLPVHLIHLYQSQLASMNSAKFWHPQVSSCTNSACNHRQALVFRHSASNFDRYVYLAVRIRSREKMEDSWQAFGDPRGIKRPKQPEEKPFAIGHLQLRSSVRFTVNLLID